MTGSEDGVTIGKNMSNRNTGPTCNTTNVSLFPSNICLVSTTPFLVPKTLPDVAECNHDVTLCDVISVPAHNLR